MCNVLPFCGGTSSYGERYDMAQQTTNIIERSRQFLLEVWQELLKVNWTSRRQLWQATKVVILGSIVLAIYLFLVDTLFSAILRWFLELRL